MQEVANLAQYSPDFGQLLEDLASELHRIQLYQLVPGFSDEASRVDAAALAARLSPELVQLWFQMALSGRRDLGLAPSARSGLEMTLLRMLAFRPATAATTAREAHSEARSPQPAPRPAASAPVPAPAAPAAAPARPATPAPASAAPAPPPSAPVEYATPAPVPLDNAEDWLALVSAAGLKGPALQLGSHCAFCGYADGVLRLHLPDEDAHLRSDNLVRQLAVAASNLLRTTVQIRFEPKPAAATADTLQRRTERQRSERQDAAEARFLADPVVAQLLGQGGSIVPDSIRPLNEN